MDSSLCCPRPLGPLFTPHPGSMQYIDLVPPQLWHFSTHVPHPMSGFCLCLSPGGEYPLCSSLPLLYVELRPKAICSPQGRSSSVFSRALLQPSLVHPPKAASLNGRSFLTQLWPCTFPAEDPETSTMTSQMTSIPTREPLPLFLGPTQCCDPSTWS